FFSSRRRHTRSDRDWSSDVCSSDLRFPLCLCTPYWIHQRFIFCKGAIFDGNIYSLQFLVDNAPCADIKMPNFRIAHLSFWQAYQIGRASCRERVEISAGEGCRENKE